MRVHRRLPVLMGLLVALASVPIARDGVGAEEKGGEKRSAPTIDERTGKVLSEAIELLNAKQYNAAKQVLGKLDPERLSPYERSHVEQILASIGYSLEDYGGARSHLKAAIDAGGLNEQELSQARYQIAQLYMAEERWKDGAAALEEWFKTATNANSSAYYLLAVAYYQMNDYMRALAPAEKAVALTDKPQESWVQLVLALYLQAENYAKALPVLQRLIALAPGKKTYWVQLSSVYGQLEDYPRALAVMQVAYNAGLITEDSEIRRLADLLVFNNVPYRGAQILTRAREQGKLREDSALFEKLANCWIAAREFTKAVAPLEQAARRAGNGDLYVRLGEVQTQLEDWPAAADAFRKALEKGSLRDTANAQVMLGIALFNQAKLADARVWFERASSSSKHRQTAQAYIQLISSRQG
jgi:tetratricopeptide (TPR) repeat protein